jgi:hypothetical protein
VSNGIFRRLRATIRARKEGADRMDEPLREVTAALEMADDELNKLVRSLREQGAEAFGSGEGAGFAKNSQRLQAVEDFQKRFAQLRQQCTGLTRRRRATRKGRRSAAQPSASRGELLRERAYVLPILQTLRDAGGSAGVREVLDRVHKRIGHQLSRETVNC